MDEIELVKTFRKNPSSKDFNKLSDSSKEILIKASINGIRAGKGDIKFYKTVLMYSKLDDNGTPLKKRIFDKKEAEYLYDTLDVSCTGMRGGDTLVGVMEMNKNAIIKVYGRNINPTRKSLDTIRHFPSLWYKFLRKLENIPFFSVMTLEEREEWLWLNQDDKKKEVLGKNQVINFLQSGNLSMKFSCEKIEILLNKKSSFSFENIYSLIPDEKGKLYTSEEILKWPKKEKYHTNFLSRNFWRLSSSYVSTKEFEGWNIEISTGNIFGDYFSKEKEIILIDNIPRKSVFSKEEEKVSRETGKKQTVGFIVKQKTHSLSTIDNDDSNSKMYYEKMGIPLDKAESIELIFDNIPVEGLILLLIKIIRFKPQTILINKDFSVPSLEILIIITVYILTDVYKSEENYILIDSDSSTGKKMISIVEYFTRMVAICIFKDSSLVDHKHLFSFFAGCLLSQRVREWKPDKEIIMNWCKFIVAAYTSKVAYEFEFDTSKHNKPYRFDINNGGIENSSAFFDIIETFELDLKKNNFINEKEDILILRNIANKTVYTKPNDVFPSSMEIYEFIDYTFDSNITYLMSQGMLNYFFTTEKISTDNQFSKIFETFYEKIISVNPRRFDFDENNFKTERFVKSIKQAQKFYFDFLQNKRQTEFQKFFENYTINSKFDIGMLSTLIGGIKVNIGPKEIIVTLNLEDPNILIPINISSVKREEISILSPIEEEAAIQAAREILKKGVPLNKFDFKYGDMAFLGMRNGDEEYLIRKTEDPEISQESLSSGRAEIPSGAGSSGKAEIPQNRSLGENNNSSKDKTELSFWKDTLDYSETFPVYQNINFNIESVFTPDYSMLKRAFFEYGSGISKEIFEKDFTFVKNLLENLDRKFVFRILYFLNSGLFSNDLNPVINMNKINIYGKSFCKGVIFEDIIVYQLLCYFSVYFSGALKADKIGIFSVKNKTLLKLLISYVSKSLKLKEDDVVKLNWSKFQLKGLSKEESKKISEKLSKNFHISKSSKDFDDTSIPEKFDYKNVDTTKQLSPGSTGILSRIFFRKNNSSEILPELPSLNSLEDKMYDYQKTIFENMILNNSKKKKGNIIWLGKEMGRTFIILEYLTYLHSQNFLPIFIVYFVSSENLSKIVDKVSSYGHNINIITEKNVGKDDFNVNVNVLNIDKKRKFPEQEINLEEYSVNIITHEVMDNCKNILIEKKFNYILLVDEIYKVLNQDSLHEIVSLSKEFVFATGTMAIKKNTFKIAKYISMFSDYEINEKNFLVYVNHMNSLNYHGVKVTETIIEAEIAPEKKRIYEEIVPQIMNGNNKKFTFQNFKNAAKISLEAIDIEMIKQTVEFVTEKDSKVFLIARDKVHQKRLHDMLKDTPISNEEVYLVDFDINFSIKNKRKIEEFEKIKKKGEEKDYKVAIAPMRKSQGYSMTGLNVMIYGSYPMENYVLDQLKKRINRDGQKEDVEYVKVRCGVFTFIEKEFPDDKNIENIVKKLIDRQTIVVSD
jgi:hypothetical protein